MIQELTAADLTALASSIPRDLNVSTLQLRNGDRLFQGFLAVENNMATPSQRAVQVTGRTGGQILYDGVYVDVWFITGTEEKTGKTVKFTATDHMRWNVAR